MGLFSMLFGKKEKTASVQKGNAKNDVTIQDVIKFIEVNASGEDGDPKSQYQYGSMFASGKAIDGETPFPQDYKKAIYWLKKSANQGYLDAITMLGQVYMEIGEPTSAIKYYKIAADKGDIVGCESLALAYAMGEGVAMDKAEAHKWFLKSAELGSPYSQFIVGNNYLEGIGTEENPREAILWLSKAADQNEVNALYTLGYIYEIGGGDIDRARVFYSKAAELGHSESIQKLKNL